MSGIVSTDDEIVSVGAPLPRIRSARALEGTKVEITWRTGQIEIKDLAPALFNHRAFVRLRDNDAAFSAVSVNEEGNALEWNGGEELSAEWIERLPVASMSNAEFRAAMDEAKMTLEGMAVTLGISRRQIAEYRKDHPIPPYIVYSVRYLLGRRNAS